MSKGSMLMGTVSGKLGDAVFFRRGGVQQQRAYVARTKDAMTRAQYAQRSQLSNLVSFYRVCRTLLNHSFTDRLQKQSSYNAFVSRNLNKTKVYLTKQAADAGAVVVAPYKVSSGALPPIVVTGTGVTSVTNISVGALTDLSDKTIADFSAAVVANNPSMDWGDQISYISLVQSTNVQTGYPVVQAALYEVTLTSDDVRLMSEVMPAQALAVQSGFLAHGEKVADGGFCWIWSRRDADGALVSSEQSIIVTSTDLYRSYTGDAAMTRATSSYDAAADLFLVPGASTAGAINAAPSVSSVVFAGKTMVAGEYFGNTPNSEDTPSFVVNGSNLADVASVMVTIETSVGGSKTTATITLSDLVVTATKVQGVLTIPGTIANRAITGISVMVDDSKLYAAAFKEDAGSDVEDPLG